MRPNNNPNNKSVNKPSDFILSKDETFILLDDINIRLKKLIDTNSEILKAQFTLIHNQNKILESYNRTHVDTVKHIELQNKTRTENNKLLKAILKELQDEAEEGESIKFSGTANITTFNIVDIPRITGTKARGYTLINEGPTNIYYLHSTIAIPDLTYTESDTTKANTKFDILAANEEFEYKGNRKKIVAIYILAVSGSPSFKTQIVW